MTKSRLLGAVVAPVFSFISFFLAPNAYASSVLVAAGGNNYGYQDQNWVNMTAALDVASGNSVDIAANFENLSQMLGYDALWLDQRWIGGSLTANEISNISSFIDTGRRVVMVGENANWTDWNNQILGIVGSSFAGSASSNILTTILTNEITAGVAGINASASGTASGGGTALFNHNTVTLWGAGNVLTMLDYNTCSDRDWALSHNSVFCGNVADWVASSSAVPIPAAAWLFGSGLLGLIGIARRKKVA